MFKTGDLVEPDDDELAALGHQGEVECQDGTSVDWSCRICGFVVDEECNLRKVE